MAETHQQDHPILSCKKMNSTRQVQLPLNHLSSVQGSLESPHDQAVTTFKTWSRNVEESRPPPSSRGKGFWLSLTVIAASNLLAAMDLTAVSTIIPTISKDLNGGSDYAWIGAAYALASTAILPLSGTLADVFGRKPIILCAIATFTLGSALAGAAQNMGMIIAARTLQGLGGGAVENLCDIILSDLVPLAERGVYQGVLALTYAFACGIGPPLGGALAVHASWRWLFYLNLPVCGLSLILAALFLNVRTPEGSVSAKLARVDWMGNLIIIIGATVAIISLSWGGIRFAWSSIQILVPLFLGLILLVFFVAYEAIVPRLPTIPWEVVSVRTSFSAYLGTFFHGLASISIIYFMPVYFQACLLTSPTKSGVNILGIALIIAPFGLVAGIVVQTTQKYRPIIAVGWALMIIGFGLLSLLKSTSQIGSWVGFQLIVSVGSGLLWAGLIFPVLSPHPAARTASALAFFNFVRSFAMTWGITIATSILRNQLKKKLPVEFANTFSDIDFTFSAIPQISHLVEPVKTQVRKAFADSLSVLWKVMIGMSFAGMISNLALEEIPMNTVTDENYGLQANA